MQVAQETKKLQIALVCTRFRKDRHKNVHIGLILHKKGIPRYDKQMTFFFFYSSEQRHGLCILDPNKQDELTFALTMIKSIHEN